MFGLSFGELMVLVIVAMVVFGPQELPKVLRKAGQWAGKIRRFASDMRAQSGIDDVLRGEGLDRDLAEIRKLARGELDGVVAAARTASTAAAASGTNATSNNTPPLYDDGYHPPDPPVTIDLAREYPSDGADAYGALPDTASAYTDQLPASPLADDPLYARGEAPPS